jgi:hypothetical protein
MVIFIAEGKPPLEDCDVLTWSFGCAGLLLPSEAPATRQQRFYFLPLPIIRTCSGNMWWCWAGEDLVARLRDQSRPTAGR